MDEHERRERREKAREADRTLQALLRERLAANRSGIRIEDLMGRRREEPEPETTEDETDKG